MDRISIYVYVWDSGGRCHTESFPFRDFRLQQAGDDSTWIAVCQHASGIGDTMDAKNIQI